MIMPRVYAEVVDGVALQTSWMMKQRLTKVAKAGHATMSINPLLLPILYEFHGAASFAELGELLLAGHLMTGHTTSFGKLIDEKILPSVFGTAKLNAKYRDMNPPFLDSCFNEIDHLVPRTNASPVLLSLKTSRWTIQLSQAVGLNHAFAKILGPTYGRQFQEIVVGVTIGTQDTLTDKYDILRGINRGKNHSVIDLTGQVHVLAGRDFWTWLNEGEAKTQDWVLEGILKGVKNSGVSKTSASLLNSYRQTFNATYARFVNANGEVDWNALLEHFSG